MYKILVPTDYSDNSKNAAEYAFSLAKHSRAKITLFHAFHVPIPTDLHTLPRNTDELAAENIYKLRNYAAALKSHHENIEVDYAAVAGFAVDEILSYSKDNDFDLIVIGTQGSSSIGNVIAGSVVTKISSKSQIPVLVIPPKVYLNKLSKVVLGYDYSEIKDLKSLGVLRKIVSVFNSELMIVNIIKDEKEMLTKTGSSNNLETFLQGIKYSFHFPVNNDIVEGLNNFVDQTEVDMIAVVPHKHSPMHRFFYKNKIKRIALQPHVPLLILPSKSN
jgi:nucleotide-binding universal stress UspA family protein